MSAGDNLVPRNDRMLRMARAAKPRGRYDLSPKQIIMARHMANAGAELSEVLNALGWPGRGYGRAVLGKRYGVWPRCLTKRMVRGDNTSLRPAELGELWRTYRPKRVTS